MHVLTITYNFDTDSVVRKCNTYEEAMKMLYDMLAEEIETVKVESGYNPSVLSWSEDDVTLVYAEGYTEKERNREYALEDCAYYRIYEVEEEKPKKYVVVCYSVHNKKVASSDAFDSEEEAYAFLEKDAQNTWQVEYENSDEEEREKIDFSLSNDGTANLSTCDGEYKWTWEVITV